MVGWNTNVIQTWLISHLRQFMFLLMESIDKKSKFFCTMIYASNLRMERRKLLRDLEMQKTITNGVPWVILGDFNVTLKVSEHSNGGAYISNDMAEFQEDSKAPGSDRYTSRFFKSSWSIVGREMCHAVKEFFLTGKLLGEKCIRGRGLRQGDPISPYLFTLVMEVLNLLIKKNIEDNMGFQYHFGCKNLKITYLCFADDLLVFCHEDTQSVRIIKKSLDEFSEHTGLLPNMRKSTILFGGLSNAEQQNILNLMPFTMSRLPVRYLGVPLITKQISISNCKPLVDKVRSKVNDWKNKALSYAGRVQLIASILSSMQNYWASVFLLPKQVIYEINKTLKGFL
ncbi:RNA-directed DNA polymerase, eukaryota, reverse transcriptase zinc-binding domain protein [Tanacetum coccineum]